MKTVIITASSFRQAKLALAELVLFLGDGSKFRGSDALILYAHAETIPREILKSVYISNERADTCMR